MRGHFAKILSVVALALVSQGCTTAIGPVGALGPQAYQASRDVGGGLPAQMPLMASSQVPVGAPAGYLSFCVRFPDQCVASPDAPSIVALTAPEWLAMEEINESVNRAIRPMDDQRHYGRAEYWNIPTDGYGDCEDYALTKRKELLAAGFPAQALRIAVVVTGQGDRHAVLMVTSDRGDFVLDNLTNEIRGWQTTGYQWIERQNPADPRGWVALGPAMDPTYLASITKAPLGSL